MKRTKNKKAIQNKNLEAKLNELEIKDSYIIIFFAIITFLFFREIILQQKFLWLDFMLQNYPCRNFAAVTLSQGILPHWNPYTYGGMPFLSDIQIAVFYPLHLLLTIFVTEDKLSFAALTNLLVFHYFMAGVFSYYLARSLDLNKWASVLCGITFMFCGFMVGHAIQPMHINPFTYMPLIFMFYHKGLSTCKLKYILLTGLFMGIVILCGHPQTTLYMFFIILLFGLYQIFFLIKENRYKLNASFFKFIAIASIPFIIGVMLGAIQLLPTIQLVELSERAEMSFSDSLIGSLNYHNLITLFSPKFFGTFEPIMVNRTIGQVVKGHVVYWGHKEWDYLYVESCIYIGLPTLIFGIFGIITLWKKRIIKFLATISLFSILFSLGDNLIIYKFFYNFVPGFDNFRYIGRFSALVLAFSFSLLGAYGFDFFVKNTESEKVKKLIKYFIILVLSFILLWLLYIAGVFENLAEGYKDKEVYNNSAFQLLKTALILQTLLGLVILYKKKIILQKVILLLFILLAFVDLYIFGSQQNNGSVSPEEYYWDQTRKEVIAQIKQRYNKELFRITGVVDYQNKIFQLNQGMLDFIYLIDGYTPLGIKDRFPPFRTNELMNVKYIAVLDTLTIQGQWKLIKNYAPRVWMTYQAIVESSLEKVAKILEDPTFDIKTKVIIDKKPENFSIDTKLVNIADYESNITSYEINEITLSVETSENGILVLSEVYYPNWKVFVDGVEKPMLRCDYSLRGVALEKGNHTVVFKYVDKYFQLGAIIALFALAIVIGGFIISSRYSLFSR